MFGDVFTAFLVVSAVGLVLGVCLALFNHFFAVEEDPRVKQIRECLPGVNCGACGFKSCDDYAANLAEGKAKPNCCVPGGADVANAIGEILGVDAGGAGSATVAFVHCNGTCGAVEKKAEYQGIDTCKAASMLYGGPSACTYGCLGCGDCAAVCPVGAICIEDGIARVDSRVCIGCTLCTDTCPKGIISMVPKAASSAVYCSNKDKGAVARKACKNACIACKKCEKACPNGAITVADNLATIDYSKCTGCGECAKVCPTGCLKDVSF